jgi:hypothetical protein
MKQKQQACDQLRTGCCSLLPDSPATVLTVLFHFFRAALTDLSFSLEGNDPAAILSNFVPVSTMIRATSCTGGQTLRRD